MGSEVTVHPVGSEVTGHTVGSEVTGHTVGSEDTQWGQRSPNTQWGQRSPYTLRAGVRGQVHTVGSKVTIHTRSTGVRGHRTHYEGWGQRSANRTGLYKVGVWVQGVPRVQGV